MQLIPFATKNYAIDNKSWEMSLARVMRSSIECIARHNCYYMRHELSNIKIMNLKDTYYSENEN